jgi:hypothetical protein
MPDFMKVETAGCPEPSISKYKHTLRNIPEEQRPRKDDARRNKLLVCHVHMAMLRKISLQQTYNFVIIMRDKLPTLKSH